MKLFSFLVKVGTYLVQKGPKFEGVPIGSEGWGNLNPIFDNLCP